MPNKTGTIHIKWIRSGIGFTRKQKEIVRSIGLHRLNQVVERPDTAHFHGLVAKVSHLVEVVSPPVAPGWSELPEYKVVPAEPAAAAQRPRVAESSPAEVAADAELETAAPAKKTAAAKSRVTPSSPSERARGSEKPKRKAAPTKPAGSARKEPKSRKGKQ